MPRSLFPFHVDLRPLILGLCCLPALLSPAQAQSYKTQALAAYNDIVNRQKDFQRYEARLPPGFPLGEGALVAFLENAELRGVVVQYAGARSGDWQEFYYRDGNPFFVYSKSYNLESRLLYRNRFYMNEKRELLGWEVNEVPQAIKGEPALLAVSRILEDSRQIFQLITDGLNANAQAAQVAPPSIVDALSDPENVPRALTPAGTAVPLPPGVEPAKKEEKPGDPSAKPPGDVAASAAAPAPPSAAAPPPALDKISDEVVDAELARWAAWANATREHTETITPFPAELVLGKIDVPPLPDAASTPPPHPPVASGPAPLPLPAAQE